MTDPYQNIVPGISLETALMIHEYTLRRKFDRFDAATSAGVILYKHDILNAEKNLYICIAIRMHLIMKKHCDGLL